MASGDMSVADNGIPAGTEDDTPPKPAQKPHFHSGIDTSQAIDDATMNEAAKRSLVMLLDESHKTLGFSDTRHLRVRLEIAMAVADTAQKGLKLKQDQEIAGKVGDAAVMLAGLFKSFPSESNNPVIHSKNTQREVPDIGETLDEGELVPGEMDRGSVTIDPEEFMGSAGQLDD